MEAARIPWRPLGRLLVEQGLLSEDQLEHALEEQESTNRRLGETLIDLGFVSHAALSHALAEQYGIEPKAETGFGTGLRAEIERRLDPHRDDEGKPAPQISDTAPALRLVPEPDTNTPERAAEVEQSYLAQLEEQWAKLAAAEARLAEAEYELTALRRAVRRRRDQAERLVARVRNRDRRIAELTAIERDEPGQTNQATSQHGDAGAPRGHVVYAQLAGRYVLVERGGEPPELDAILELPELGIEKLVVCRIGKSPLPGDARPCVFAQPAQSRD